MEITAVFAEHIIKPLTFACIWMAEFQFGSNSVIVNTLELFIMILVFSYFDFDQGHSDVRKQKLLHQLSIKVLKEFEWKQV